MIKRLKLDRRAETKESTMSGLIIMVALIVLILLFMWLFSGKLDKIFSSVQDVQVAVTTCRGYATSIDSELGSLKTSYCEILSDKYDIDGRSEYITCKYLESIGKLEATDIDCSNIDEKIKAKFCVNKKLDADEIVTGKECSEFLNCEGICQAIESKGGKIKGTCETGEKDLTKYASDAGGKKCCCVESSE